MQLAAQEFLRLVEATGKIVFLDIEATGLHGDYNSASVVSMKPYKKPPRTWSVIRPGDDKPMLEQVKGELEKYSCWVTYYGKMFDIKMLNTRLTRWGLLPIEPRHHIDMYWQLKHHLLMSRRSQAHLLRFFDCEIQKMDVNPEMWNQVLANPKKYLPTLIKRCESDTAGLEALYNKTRHLIRDITK